MNISISRVVIVLVILFLSALAIIYVTPLFAPFILGWLIAYFINPFVNFLQKRVKISRWSLPRWAAVALALLLFVAIFVGIITLIIAEVIIEIGHLGEILPTYINQVTEFFKEYIPSEQVKLYIFNTQDWFGKLDPQYKEQLESNLGEWVAVLGNFSVKIINSFFSSVLQFLSSLPNMATIFVISILASFFISKDFTQLNKRLTSWIPNNFINSTRAVFTDLKRALFGFIKAQFILISITAFIVIIGLMILRVEYAITIGLITGLVELLPYLGTGTIFVPWIIYLYFTKQYSLVIGLSILYGVIIIVRQIMEPKILADSIGLNPLVVLISLFVGLKLFGILGLIVGPVLVVILMAIYNANVFHDLWAYIQKKPI